MQNKYLDRIAILFVAVLIVSFGYLYAKQNLSGPTGSKPTDQNTNQQQHAQNPGSPITVATAAVKKFKTADEFEKFLSDQGNANAYYGGSMMADGFGGGPAIRKMAPSPSLELGMPSDFAGLSTNDLKSNSGTDYSQTNVQVEGVDEADIVKTDGRYIYSVSRNNLFIVDAYPAGDSKVLAKIEFKSQPQDIYISEDHNRLIVYGQDYQMYQATVCKRLCPNSQFTFFKIFDVSDPKNPKQLKNYDFEGSYINSRMIGDYVYFITSKYGDVSINPRPLPIVIEDGEKIMNDPSAPGYTFPNVYYFDIPYESFNLTTVHTVNVKDVGTPVIGDTYTMDYNQQLYVSQDNIYLAYQQHVNEEQVMYDAFRSYLLPKLPQRDQDRIVEIEGTPSYILTKNEKLGKIMLIIERYMNTLSEDEQKSLQTELETKVKERYMQLVKEMEKTIIHKIAIDKGTLTFKASGQVTGTVLNQYSMDESDGYFRIATTRSRTWSQYLDENDRQPFSNVYVLDKDMKVIGSLEGIAKNEQIYSARFMGKRVYLVTFQRTDPFFAIDLSDPKNPKVLGELKMPGFSNYLHPYDDTTIIGLGKETEETQAGSVIQKGVKIALIDVTDVNHPKEIAKYVDPDQASYSAAQNDPKAFLFSKEKGIVVIPMNSQQGTPIPLGITRPGTPIRSSYFNGAYVFTITKDKIELKGKISHGQIKAQNPEMYYGDYYSGNVKRSLYIKDTLYTVSDDMLKMNALTDLKEVKSLELKKESSTSNDFNVVN